MSPKAHHALEVPPAGGLAVVVLLFVLACPFLGAQDAGRARVALFQPEGLGGDAALASVLATVADTVDISLTVLQRYEVTRAPAADPRTDLDAVRAYCRKNRMDQAILGSGSATTDGGYRFRLAVYDRKADRITIDQQGVSKGSLDMFDVTDTLVASVLNALSGRHLAFGALAVQCDPPGATISVNGRDVGAAPVSLRGLPTGSVEISGRMDGHEPARSTVAIGDGETVNVSLGLPRSTGTLFVDMPRDGVATITSAEIGQKTISGPGSLNLPTGSYHVIAGSPGLPNASGDVTVGRAETAHWMPWSSGYLDVRSVPPGATVSVDGQDTGTSPVVVPMEPGEVHHVELRLSGYQTISADLIEEAGTKAVFSRTLKAVEDAAAPPAVAAAQPKIGVPVPRAPIEIDGDFARWSAVPALLGGSGHSGDIFLDKVYVAMDQDEEHFFFRIDIADPKAASLFHSSNFDTLHPSSYGIDLMNGSKAVRLHVYYCDTLTLMKGGGRSPAGTVPSRWIVDMDVQDNGTWTVAEDVGARFVMKGSFLEASFPMKAIRHALALPVSGGSCRVDARTGYVDSGFGNGAQDWNRYATPWQLEAGSGETTASTTISF